MSLVKQTISINVIYNTDSSAGPGDTLDKLAEFLDEPGVIKAHKVGPVVPVEFGDEKPRRGRRKQAETATEQPKAQKGGK